MSISEDQAKYIGSEDLIEGSRGLELRLPWITEGAVYKLDEVLSQDDVVLEVGTGGSTLFFAERTGDVIAIETSHEWASKVEAAASEFKKLVYMIIPIEDVLCDVITELGDMMHSITVFFVDPQGGYDRSKILDTFLNVRNKLAPRLRVIILDNYSEQAWFPLHYDKHLSLGEDWDEFSYDNFRWAGSGTRIYIKKDKHED